LIVYYNLSIDEWVKRGKKNTMEKIENPPDYEMPWWFGWDHLHKSHQASLTRKHPAFYGPLFHVDEFYMQRGYVWPSHHHPDVRDACEQDGFNLDTLFAPINKATVKSEEDSRKALYTVVQLRAMCKERGIRGYSGKRKDELLSMLGLSPQ
jgi:hypothetical protein